MAIPKIQMRTVGSSEMGRSYGVYADGVPVVMINAFADGTTHATANLGEETIKFLQAFAPKQQTPR